MDTSFLGSPKFVVDNRYGKIDDSTAEYEILNSMEYLSSKGAFEFSHAISICKDGEEKDIKKGSSKP